MKVKVILMVTERKKKRFHSRRSYAKHINSRYSKELYGLCKVVSEWIPVGTSENKIIMEFLKEVVMFVKGERAQGKLFENTEIEEAIDAIDADDSHVFHVNDLQAKGVKQ